MVERTVNEAAVLHTQTLCGARTPCEHALASRCSDKAQHHFTACKLQRRTGGSMKSVTAIGHCNQSKNSCCRCRAQVPTEQCIRPAGLKTQYTSASCVAAVSPGYSVDEEQRTSTHKLPQQPSSCKRCSARCQLPDASWQTARTIKPTSANMSQQQSCSRAVLRAGLTGKRGGRTGRACRASASEHGIVRSCTLPQNGQKNLECCETSIFLMIFRKEAP